MRRNLVERTLSAATKAGVTDAYLYPNYVASGRVDEVFAGHHEENLARLRRAQRGC